MKKVAIIYNSIHHNNTEKLIKSIDNIDIYKTSEVENIDLAKYDLVGFASGIYMGKIHKSIDMIINKHQKELKDIFLVYTSGSGNNKYGNSYKNELEKRGLNIINIYSCQGYDTYGPFKLIGGIAKGHPNEKDIINFREFIKNISK